MKKKTSRTAVDKSKTYDPARIEPYWQRKWTRSKIFVSKKIKRHSISSGKRSDDKFYVLDMFPYPSGEGLHVGHPKGYIATDVVSRFQRMNGKSVLHPMGFDAFGLPAENYALKTKTNPADAVKKNVKRFKEQLEVLGLDYDWSREINTTDPGYYKWTQWIFLKMLEKGLAYESYEPINWCPSCKTGLANEDIEDGKCERCGTVVEKKPMRQWVLRIMDYAERLLKDLDAKNIPEYFTKEGTDAFRRDVTVSERKVVHCIIKHWHKNEFLCMRWKANDWRGLVVGGIENGETPIETAVREATEETGYRNIEVRGVVGEMVSNFYQEIKKENRRAHVTTVYLELKDGAKDEISDYEKSIQDMEWIPYDRVRDFLNRDDLKHEWDVFTGAVKGGSLLDWPDSIKELQRNWIGKSEGALIKFKMKVGNKEDGDIEVFTTRPDTLYGVTYVVLAPEHRLIDKLLPKISNKKEVEEYIVLAKKESDMERTNATKEKTGVRLQGISAVNPANGEDVPVFIADYVLADYGTGAVMAVPAHDERDWDFAQKYKLPMKQVIAPYFTETSGQDTPRADKKTVHRQNIYAIVKHWSEDKFICLDWKGIGWHSLIVGGVEKDEDKIDGAKREVYEETGYKNIKFIKKVGPELHTHHFAPHKDENRYGYCQALYFELEDGEQSVVADHESNKHEVKWIDRSQVGNYLNLKNNIFIWNVFINGETSFDGDGKLINSAQFDGKDSDKVKKGITESVHGKWVAKYKLRDWVFSRQRYWGEPIPVIHCSKCGVVPVPEKDLPVKLPKVKSYEPTGTGESPLAAISSWVNVKCPRCKGPGKRETNTMPQWAGSSWYYLRYEDPKNKKQLVGPDKEKYWSPVDLYVGGAEHATRHLIYARFWHKFLQDIGVVSYPEPFIKLQHVGLIMGEDGRKMSKRFGNVVNPDDVVKTFGADSLRVYEMFMGPFDQSISWNTSSIVGARRFVERVWKLFNKVSLSKNKKTTEVVTSGKADIVINKAMVKVTEDIANMRFNTAISALMIAVNELENEQTLGRGQFESLLKLLAPFAPHVTEELWKELGNKKSIHISAWPKPDMSLVKEAENKIIVQVNGKVRDSFMAPSTTTDEQLENMAKETTGAKKWLENKSIVKVIVVTGRLVNIVVK